MLLVLPDPRLHAKIRRAIPRHRVSLPDVGVVAVALQEESPLLQHWRCLDHDLKGRYATYKMGN